MNILLFAEGHPREWPILNKLSGHFPQTVWVEPIYAPAKKPNVFRKIGRFYYSLRFRIHRMITLKSINTPPPNFDHHIRFSWHEIKSQKGMNLLDDLQPDIILTCRAPILESEIINKAQWGAINVHFGIVPYYRGNEGLFWAMLNKDYQTLGGSIHRIDTGVDTGHKLVDVYPKLEGGESLIETEIAVSQMLSEALIKCLSRIEKNNSIPKGQPQQSLGHNYKQADRSWKKDLLYLLEKTGHSIPPQKNEIRFFFKQPHR